MKQVLVLIDFSDLAPSVVKVGGEIARALGARLLLVHVERRQEQFADEVVRGSPAREQAARDVRHHRRALEILELELNRQGTDVERKILAATSGRGDPRRRILQEIDSLRPDVIVMGTRQRSTLRRLFLGSVSDAVISKARCPVVLVPRAS